MCSCIAAWAVLRVKIRADFSQPAALLAEDHEWIQSPEIGVDRIMLDRIGGEVARATSIVRYAPGSSFARHEHALGEEFLVLAGVFSDEHGHYPAGTYVRNPPGSGHSPYSEDGCTILVKLRQFDERDLTPVVIETDVSPAWKNATTPGLQVLELYEFGREHVQMLRLQARNALNLYSGPGGLEILLVRGSATRDQQALSANTWLRLPEGAELDLRAIDDVLLWVKTGHLPAAA